MTLNLIGDEKTLLGEIYWKKSSLFFFYVNKIFFLCSFIYLCPLSKISEYAERSGGVVSLQAPVALDHALFREEFLLKRMSD